MKPSASELKLHREGSQETTRVGIEIPRQTDPWGENETGRTLRKKEEAEEKDETDESQRWRAEESGRDA